MNTYGFVIYQKFAWSNSAEKKYYYLAETINASGDAEAALAYMNKFLKIRPYSKSGLIQAAFYTSSLDGKEKAIDIIDSFLKVSTCKRKGG